MHFESLGQHHAPALLTFELKNKAYFEAFIAAREQGFYTTHGISQHIDQLANTNNQRAFILLSQGEIIARANLKEIVNSQAEIGYRVAQQASGKGIATLCVNHLINEASTLSIALLNAFVMDNNKASEHVLKKNNFNLNLCLPNHYDHHGKKLHGFIYQRHCD
ncbi:GNAT family N-acetyltransferase [Thalassotalea ganghwensis]